LHEAGKRGFRLIDVIVIILKEALDIGARTIGWKRAEISSSVSRG
jgi:hypothetical protein